MRLKSMLVCSCLTLFTACGREEAPSVRNASIEASARGRSQALQTHEREVERKLAHVDQSTSDVPHAIRTTTAGTSVPPSASTTRLMSEEKAITSTPSPEAAYFSGIESLRTSVEQITAAVESNDEARITQAVADARAAVQRFRGASAGTSKYFSILAGIDAELNRLETQRGAGAATRAHKISGMVDELDKL